jgi:hypothetical protein
VHIKVNLNPVCVRKTHLAKKSARRPPIGDKHKTRRQKGVFYLLDGLACDLEPMATGARQKKSVSRLPSAETRWRTCEEAFAAAAGPKRREVLATGARHRKLDAGFYTLFNCEKRSRTSFLLFSIQAYSCSHIHHVLCR